MVEGKDKANSAHVAQLKHLYLHYNCDHSQIVDLLRILLLSTSSYDKQHIPNSI